MIVLLKPIFELLTGEVTVFNNVIYNYIAILIIGEIAYRIAKNLVGDLYHLGVIDGKASGSIIHWVVRFFVYVAIAYLLRFTIWLINFVSSIPFWIWVVVTSIVLGTIIIFIVLKRRKANRQKNN